MNDNCRILLLDDQLRLHRVIIEPHQLNYKSVLQMDQLHGQGQLLVALIV